MFKVIRNSGCFLAVSLMVMSLVSCGGGGGGSGTVGGTPLWITDAPSKNTYQSVFVTIVEVSVNHEVNGWTLLTDLDLPQTIELLGLTNGVRSQLGVVNLEPGHYNQMRLRLSEEVSANYVIDSQGETINLKVPSGGQTGIKLVNGFDIESSVSTDLILDFDVHKSIHAHPAGKTDSWRLRPTIKVVEIENSVSGTVEAGGDGEEHPWVSAHLYDPDTFETVQVAGSFSEVDGTYFMFLPINITESPYNILAMKEGFVPVCQSLPSSASSEYTGIDFTLLTPVETGTLSGSIVNLPIPGADDEFSVYLTITQSINCGGNNILLEVDSSNFVNTVGGTIFYGPIILPDGEYQIDVWADGTPTSFYGTITVAAGTTLPDIDLAAP